MVYFDNAATTGRKPEPVVQAVTAALLELSVNAGRGSYELARKATKLIDECKERIMKLAGLQRGYHVFFSPSATISLNQLLLALPCDNYSSVYVTPFEHNAVMRTVEHIRHKSGCSLHVVPFDRNTWELQKEDLRSQFLRNKPEYLITSLVSNTTGYLLPVYEMTQLAHEFGAKVIVDCAQALGSVDVNYAQIGADAYVFAGHKTLYGPYGIAGTILADSWNISPGIFGGTGSDSLSLDMPSPDNGGYEPGSPNICVLFCYR